MCGIYGCIGRTDYNKTEECINSISHRGPDAVNIKIMEGASFAHTRLAILDTSSGANQPFVDESGRYTLIYNGEIYNYIELKKELESKGIRFKTNSDTEVVLYAYIIWGKKCQDRFNGMWAFAIWDKEEKHLFLSRDRFGVKPLYYYREKNVFYFASEMKALFPVMQQKKINYVIFDKQDYFGYESTEASPFRNIFKLKAGECATYFNGELRTEQWWRTIDNLISVPDTYDEQVLMLRELFENACEIRMRSDVPVGTALSGGVDSSAVVGFMKHISDRNAANVNREWRNVFVASFPGATTDEAKYADLAASHVGLEINKVVINPEELPEKLLQYMYLCEDPYITPPLPFIQTYGAISKKGIKVSIDGHGADELFGGYGVGVAGAVSRNSTDDEIKIAYEAFINIRSDFYEPISYSQFKDMVMRQNNNRDIPSLDLLNNILYKETHESILPTILRCYDRYSMSNGVEIRMPFMDYRIVSFAFSIPWTSKIGNGFGKKIVRDMASPYMTEEIIYRRDKVGFNSPMDSWLNNKTIKDFFGDLVNSDDFATNNLTDPIVARACFEEFYKKDQNTISDGEKVWRSIMPYLWRKAMGA